MFQAIRNWLEQKFGRLLKTALGNGFFVIDAGQKKELTLAKMTIEVEQWRFMGLIPRSASAKPDLSRSPIRLRRLFRLLVTFWRTNVIEHTRRKILMSWGENSKVQRKRGLNNPQKEREGEAARLSEGFGEKHLRVLIGERPERLSSETPRSTRQAIVSNLRRDG